MLIFNDEIAVNTKDFLVFKQTKSGTVYNIKRNFYALSLRTKGHSVFRYGNKEVPVTAKSVAFVPAMLDYTRTSEKDEMLVIHFDLYGMTYTDIEIYYPQDFDEVYTLFLQAQKVWKDKKEGYRLKSSELLLKILRRLRTDFYASKPQTQYELIKQIKTEILKNYANPDYSITALEENLSVSPVYLRRIFKEQTGKTVKEYLITVRIDQAKKLLAEKYHTVKQIAALCGFRNEKYFTNVFRSVIGATPTKYRKTH